MGTVDFPCGNSGRSVKPITHLSSGRSQVWVELYPFSSTCLYLLVVVTDLDFVEPLSLTKEGYFQICRWAWLGLGPVSQSPAHRPRGCEDVAMAVSRASRSRSRTSSGHLRGRHQHHHHHHRTVSCFPALPSSMLVSLCCFQSQAAI